MLSFVVSAVIGALIGASIGAVGGYAWAGAGWKKRVDEASDLARALEEGKLGQTLEEKGPESFRILARNLNGVSANFQEILLLFAHHVRNLRDSVEAGDGSETPESQELLDELSEMGRMLHDFDYYRVRIEGDSITDMGVAPGKTTAGAAETAAPGELVTSPRSRVAGGSYDD